MKPDSFGDRLVLMLSRQAPAHRNGRSRNNHRVRGDRFDHTTEVAPLVSTNGNGYRIRRDTFADRLLLVLGRQAPAYRRGRFESGHRARIALPKGTPEETPLNIKMVEVPELVGRKTRPTQQETEGDGWESRADHKSMVTSRVHGEDGGLRSPISIGGLPPLQRRQRRQTGLVVSLIVGLTVIVGVAYMAGRASAPSATQYGSAPGARPATQDQPAGTPAETQGPFTPNPSVAATNFDPRAQFTIAYELQQLLVRPESRCDPIAIDLDEPRVNPPIDYADLLMDTCNGRQALKFGQSDASLARDPRATPTECEETIRTSSFGPGATLPIRSGYVLCVATSRAAALEQGITGKIAVVDIKNVASDGTVTLIVSAWNIPR
jgi:hypothetical protein